MNISSDDNFLRYRRAQSVTKAEEITEREKRARKRQSDRPCHKPRDSLFSWSSEFTDFTGLVNWGFLMLTIGGLRLCLENFIKYGIRVNPFAWVSVLTGCNKGFNHQYPAIVLLIFCVVPVVLCLLTEKAMATGIMSQKVGIFLQVSNIISIFSLPVIVIQFKGPEFGFAGATTVCLVYLVLFMKLWSYCQTNYWCRQGVKTVKRRTQLRRQSLSAPNSNTLMNAEFEQINEEDSVLDGLTKYPDNLNLKDLFYFLLAPTLCYELNFPRTTRIRKRFLIKRLIEVIFGINLMLALFQQWMIPSVTNSVDPFSQMTLLKTTERLLKLAVPNHLIWLCFFYLSFHSFMNLMGELLQFADRKFYGDWWNANNLAVFWSSWNMPVHMWALRHVYIPITDMGYNKAAASLTVFAISALFHEYLVSVPLQMYRAWAFLGMMAQPPLLVISRVAQLQLGPRWGNLLVWSSLILGQPLAIMMYYHDYALAHLPPGDATAVA